MALTELEISVRGIGAVEKAVIPANRHVWLIGPNGSGKSTLARIRYAVEQVLVSGEELLRALSPVVHPALTGGSGRSLAEILPEPRTKVESGLERVASVIGAAVLETLGGDPVGWLRRGSALDIRLGARWVIHLRFTPTGKTRADVEVRESELATPLTSLAANTPVSFPVLGDAVLEWVSGGRASDWSRESLRRNIPVAYLPAGRSGIVAASASLASAMTMVGAGVAGFRRMDVAPFPLTTAAFMSLLINTQVPQGRPHSAQTTLRSLLGGRMLVTQQGGSGPILGFKSDSLGHVPLPRMSSALTELGPLDIALSALRPGGLLILEEPESHVHPRSLRQLARVLCQASSRWHVMCTTHNDLLLRAIAVETKGQRHASPPVLMSGSATMRGYYEWTSTHRLIDFVDQGPFLDPASDLLDDTLSVFGRELATADGDVG